MQIAIPLFDRFTALDAVGPYQVLVPLPGAKIIFVAERPRGVTDESGSLTLQADAALRRRPAPGHHRRPRRPRPGRPDGPRPAARLAASRPTRPAPGPRRSAPARSSWPRPACSPAARPPPTGRPMDELARLGVTPRHERYVFDGKYATAAGVSAGIDMALALAGRIGGRRGGAAHPARHRVRPAAAVQRRLARTAPAEIVAALRAASRFTADEEQRRDEVKTRSRSGKWV